MVTGILGLASAISPDFTRACVGDYLRAFCLFSLLRGEIRRKKVIVIGQDVGELLRMVLTPLPGYV